MSRTFACSRCGQRYQVDPSLAGKKIRCKACGEVVHIPGPRPVDPPPAERPARPSARSAPPATSAFDWMDETDETEADSPALPRTTGPKAKPPGGWDLAASRSSRRPGLSSRLDPTTVKYLGIAGSAVVGLIVIILVGAMVFGSGETRHKAAIAAHEQVVEEGLAALDELSDLFARVEDQDFARHMAPRAERLAHSLVELQARAAQLPKLPPDVQARVTAKYRKQTNASLRKWKQAFARVRRLPGVAEALQGVIDEVATAGT